MKGTKSDFHKKKNLSLTAKFSSYYLLTLLETVQSKSLKAQSFNYGVNHKPKLHYSKCYNLRYSYKSSDCTIEETHISTVKFILPMDV